MTKSPSSTDGRFGPAGPITTMLLLAVSIMLTSCAGSRATVRTAQVPSLSDALECAREEGEAMDFDVTRLDRDENLLVLERADESVERSQPSFQRAVDQLRLEPGPGEPGSDRDLEVTARTYHLHRTREGGAIRRPQAVSEGAVEAADELIDRCAAEMAAGR